jgi:hypothetical protein
MTPCADNRVDDSENIVAAPFRRATLYVAHVDAHVRLGLDRVEGVAQAFGPSHHVNASVVMCVGSAARSSGALTGDESFGPEPTLRFPARDSPPRLPLHSFRYPAVRTEVP